MANYQATKLLIELREQAGLTQKHVAEQIFNVRRKTVVDWENANQSPPQKRRLQFLQYLLATLNLWQDIDRFHIIWEKLMVIEWGWDVLTIGEHWWLAQARHGEVSNTLIPTMPPYLNIKRFLGRSTLLKNIQQALFNSRHIALVGMAGVGKTATTVKIADDDVTHQQFKDGILWANIGQQPDVFRTLGRWAQSLGHDVSGQLSIPKRAATIKRIIGDKKLLLILDDIWDEVTAEQLLCGGRNCTYLLTTRIQSVAEAFTTHENIIHIPELTQLSAYDLLKQIAPDVCRVYETQTRELVMSTGGLPLTVSLLGGYLAAPEHRYFTNNQGFALKAVSSAEQRLQLAHQRLGSLDDASLTLRETIALSLEHLPESLRHAFYRFGAFAAKPDWFDEDAVAEIVQVDTRTLALLVDRNLLEISTSQKLMLHQSVSDFARSYMSVDAALHHWRYYQSIASHEPRNWQIIDPCYDQIRWAWSQRAATLSDETNCFDMIIALRSFQGMRGLQQDSVDWLKVGIDVATRHNQNKELAYFTYLLAGVHARPGNWDMALAMYDECLQLYRRLDDLDGQAQVFRSVGYIYHQQGDYEESIDLYEQGLQIYESQQNLHAMAKTLIQLGKSLDHVGQIDAAIEKFNRTIDIWTEAGNEHGLAIVKASLGDLYRRQLQFNRAKQLLDESLAGIMDSGSIHDQAHILLKMALLYSDQKLDQETLEFLNEALPLFERVEDDQGKGHVYAEFGYVYEQQGNLQQAHAKWTEALELLHPDSIMAQLLKFNLATPK